MNRNKTAKGFACLITNTRPTRPAEFSFTFRLSRRVLYSSSGTGMNRQITAMVLPSTAIHATETADGTNSARYSGKWTSSKKPKALDFIAVSIATVLHVVSPYLNARMIQ